MVSQKCTLLCVAIFCFSLVKSNLLPNASSPTHILVRSKRALGTDAVFFVPYLARYGTQAEQQLFAAEVRRSDTSRNRADKRFKNLSQYPSLGGTGSYFAAIRNAGNKIKVDIGSADAGKLSQLQTLQQKMIQVVRTRQNQMRIADSRYNQQLSKAKTPGAKAALTRSHQFEKKNHQNTVSAWQNSANSVNAAINQRTTALKNQPKPAAPKSPSPQPPSQKPPAQKKPPSKPRTSSPSGLLTFIGGLPFLF